MTRATGGLDVLVLGAGAREHALAWRLARDDSVGRVSIAPGNGGTAAVGRNVDDLPILDPVTVVRHAARERYGLVVVGPEAPLAAGVAGALRQAHVPVLGPGVEAARLETSKAFAKDVMRRAGVPTARAEAFQAAADAVAHARAADADGRSLVVKADWLAGGKGVVVPEDVAETEEAIRELFATPEGSRRGASVLLEERLVGREVSLLALVSGPRVAPLAAACDYKRRDDDDRGPNTGGMGAYAPVPWFGRREIERATAEILEPVAWRMARDGVPYSGVLYAGLMMVGDQLSVLEFNARFGDPETQAIVPLLDGDLAAALLACAVGDVGEAEATVALGSGAAVAVVVASEGYPGDAVLGRRIDGAEPSAPSDDGAVLCFHGATRRVADAYDAAGGRVVTFVGRGSELEQAREAAYRAV
ncbi:MAG: phosphoribosylamine--glycine ligase, partial [Chloroflexota bacterium]|nr:phosphoribosylamine--glycine ligase [Chloroflexota bacterium]